MGRLDELLIFEDTCSVTMFDMRFQIHRDGRERGIWVRLQDASFARKAEETALLEWPQVLRAYNAIGNQLRKHGYLPPLPRVAEKKPAKKKSAKAKRKARR